MRIINILGVSVLYLPIIYKYKSKRAAAVFLNGVMFHTNENNVYLKYYDIAMNAIMCIYTHYEYEKAYYYILTSFLSYVLTNILEKKDKITRNTGDVLHVLFVQGVLSACLNKIKKNQSLSLV